MTALAPFDATRHHIGLGPVDQEEPWGFIVAGGYDRAGQSYGAPTDFGGENDQLGLPTLSRWTQDDFLGGAYQSTWKDPAMFSNSLNMLPAQFDKSLRTVPPLAKRHGGYSDNGNRVPWAMFTSAGGHIWGVFSNGIIRWKLLDNDGLDVNQYGYDISNPYAANDNITWGHFDRGSNMILVAWDNGTAGGIERFLAPAMTRPSDTYTFIGRPENGGRPVRRFTVMNGLYICQCGASLWTTDVPEDLSPYAWTNRGKLPGQWIESVQFNGQLYILCANEDDGTTLVTFDPKVNAVLPVAEFPYNFRGRAIAVYAGRLFVGGSGTDIEGGDRNAEMYEVTASSVRLVRTFAPQASQSGYFASKPKSIPGFGVHEGLLWFGDWGRGLVAYDVTSDGFFGGSMLQTPNGVSQIHKFVSIREKVYCWIVNPINGNDDGLYRIATTYDVAAGRVAGFEGHAITSDFQPEPDRRKRWAVMKVLTRFGSCQVDYSIEGGNPGGDTFTQLPATTDVNGQDYVTTVDLSSVPLSERVRFRVRMPRGTDVTGYTELVAYTVGFTMLDSGKWSWQFTVNGTLKVEGTAGFTLDQDIHDIGTELRRYWREQIPLKYRDLDGNTYAAIVKGFRESQPIVAPADPVSGGREAFYAVTLLEV